MNVTPLQIGWETAGNALARYALTLFALLFMAGTGYAQTVITDKDDYSPGQYVIVSGTGWEPGETVSFDFHETPKVCTTDHHLRSTIAKEDGSILYDQFLINEKHLGVAFVLTATGQTSGLTAVTNFTDAGIRNVSIVGTTSTSFCAGQVITVRFESTSANLSTAGGGQFLDNNIFYVQLSNASGVFPTSQAPGNNINIGFIETSKNDFHEVAATIPNGITTGTYKIRVVSTKPVTNAPEIGMFSIADKPTDASAGNDQLTATGNSTTLAGNSPIVGTGAWSIVSGTGGSFGTAATATSTNPTATFNGAAGVDYTLHWTIKNGDCTSFDEVAIKFNQITTTTTAANATATYGDAAVTLSATVSPTPGSGSVEFYINGGKVGAGLIGAGGTATFTYNPGELNATSASVSHTIQATYLGSGFYTASTSTTSTLTIDKAATTTVVTFASGPFTYTGAAIEPATVQVTGPGLNLVPTASYSNNTNAGNATASYAYVGNDNYEASGDSKDFTIGKAEQVITWLTPAAITYGTALSDDQLNASALGGATLTYSPAAGTLLNAGENQELSVTAAETGNYNPTSKTITIKVNKANATVHVTVGGPYTFDNTIKSVSSATVTGVAGADLGAATVVYKQAGTAVSPVNAGAYEVHASFAGDTNYNPASDNNNSITIEKAETTTVITLTPGLFTYTGSAITPATVKVTGAGGLDLTPAAVYTNNVNAGTATASYAYTETANYLASADSEGFTISKADVLFNVAGKRVTYDGTAHAAAGTATGVKGETLAGLDLGASFTNVPGGTANWSFTDQTGNYNNFNGTAAIEIGSRAVTVSADAQKKMEGDIDPALTYTITAGSVIPGDVFAGELSRVNGTSAGTYAITQNTLTLGNNYNLSFVSAKLTIYAAPIVSISVSDPVAVNNTSTATATLGGDVFNKVWTIVSPSGVVSTYVVADNLINPPTEISQSISSASVGVYVVTLSYQNGVGASFTTDKGFLVFFDPTAGFVTGGGWIESPTGASTAFPDAVGKANFGFVSKYEKGAKVPTGNTEFQFKAGDLNFKSTNYQWLTVAGARAQYKGTGTINGTGSYGFILTAIDGQVSGGGGVDKFRIKIWNGSNENSIVYDNQSGFSDEAVLTTAIQGSIVIHTPPTNTKGSTTTTTKRVVGDEAPVNAFASITAYPNPLSQQLFVALPEMAAQQVSLIIYSNDGRVMLRKLVQTSGTPMKVELNESFDQWPAGLYLLKVDAQGQQKVVKLVK